MCSIFASVWFTSSAVRRPVAGSNVRLHHPHPSWSYTSLTDSSTSSSASALQYACNGVWHMVAGVT
eukprot:2491032-Rhodomonas_salina.1